MPYSLRVEKLNYLEVFFVGDLAILPKVNINHLFIQYRLGNIYPLSFNSILLYFVAQIVPALIIADLLVNAFTPLTYPNHMYGAGGVCLSFMILNIG